jgi:hypothetical protein
LLALLKERQQRREAIAATLTSLAAVGRASVSRRSIETKVRDRLKEWRDRLLTRDVPTTRQWLREVLIGPLKLTPEGKVYRFEGELAMGALLSGITGLPTVVASPRGNRIDYTPKFLGNWRSDRRAA